jgi:hypothetical protein
LRWRREQRCLSFSRNELTCDSAGESVLRSVRPSKRATGALANFYRFQTGHAASATATASKSNWWTHLLQSPLQSINSDRVCRRCHTRVNAFSFSLTWEKNICQGRTASDVRPLATPQKQPSRQNDEPSTFLAGANSAKPWFLQAIGGKEGMSEPARGSA